MSQCMRFALITRGGRWEGGRECILCLPWGEIFDVNLTESFGGIGYLLYHTIFTMCNVEGTVLYEYSACYE